LSVTPTDPTLVMWFRPDVRRPVFRAWLKAFLFISAAMLFLAVPLGLAEVSPGIRIIGTLVGGACLVAGPIYLLVKLQRILGPEIFLAIHTTGLRWCDEGEDRRIPWTAIDALLLEEDPPRVVVTVDGGPPLVLREAFLDIEPASLLKLLEDLRMKALMGLPVRPRPETG